MPVRRIDQTLAEPITVSEARTHCRVDLTGEPIIDAAEDAWFAMAISAARESAEAMTERTISRCNWLLTLDSFPCEILLPNPRALSVSSLQYTDVDGQTQTLDPASYVLDNAGEYRNWVETAEGFDWPDTSPDTINNVRVTYAAGYESPALVPAPIKQWLLLSVETLYRHRGAVITGTTVGELPRSFFDGLLDPYRSPSL